MPEQIMENRATSAWMAVLDGLIGDLGRALEQMPATPAPPAAVAANYPPLQAIDQRLAQMQAGLERAEADAGKAQTQLDAVIQPLQQWLAQLRTSHEKLAGGESEIRNPISEIRYPKGMMAR